MKLNKDEMEAFLNDVPFYKNNECFCLGKTLEDTGKILKQLADENERRKGDTNVAMDTRNFDESCKVDSSNKGHSEH